MSISQRNPDSWYLKNLRTDLALLFKIALTAFYIKCWESQFSWCTLFPYVFFFWFYPLSFSLFVFWVKYFKKSFGDSEFWVSYGHFYCWLGLLVINYCLFVRLVSFYWLLHILYVGELEALAAVSSHSWVNLRSSQWPSSGRWPFNPIREPPD